MRRTDNLITFHVLKSGSLNLLEPSWPVHACNGLALPFTCHTKPYITLKYIHLDISGVSLLNCKKSRCIQQALTVPTLNSKHFSSLMYLLGSSKLSEDQQMFVKPSCLCSFGVHFLDLRL